MKSRLSAHQKTFITVVAPEVVTTVAELNAAIKSNCTIIISADIDDM